MELTINVTGIDALVAAINRLAGVETNASTGTVEAAQTVSALPSAQPLVNNLHNNYPQVQPAQAYAQPPASLPGGNMPVQAAPPVQQSQPPVQALPTTNVTENFTQDRIAVAMTGLMDAGKQDALMGILSQFGAQSLMQIPKEQYPAVVLALRGAGANI